MEFAEQAGSSTNEPRTPVMQEAEPKHQISAMGDASNGFDRLEGSLKFMTAKVKR